MRALEAPEEAIAAGIIASRRESCKRYRNVVMANSPGRNRVISSINHCSFSRSFSRIALARHNSASNCIRAVAVRDARRLRGPEPERVSARQRGLHRHGRDEARPHGLTRQAGEKVARWADGLMGNSYHVPVMGNAAPIGVSRGVNHDSRNRNNFLLIIGTALSFLCPSTQRFRCPPPSNSPPSRAAARPTQERPRRRKAAVRRLRKEERGAVAKPPSPDASRRDYGVHTSHRACRRPPGAPFSAKRGRCRRRRRMGCGKQGAWTASSR